MKLSEAFKKIHNASAEVTEPPQSALPPEARSLDDDRVCNCGDQIIKFATEDSALGDPDVQNIIKYKNSVLQQTPANSAERAGYNAAVASVLRKAIGSQTKIGKPGGKLFESRERGVDLIDSLESQFTRENGPTGLMHHIFRHEAHGPTSTDPEDVSSLTDGKGQAFSESVRQAIADHLETFGKETSSAQSRTEVMPLDRSSLPAQTQRRLESCPACQATMNILGSVRERFIDQGGSQQQWEEMHDRFASGKPEKTVSPLLLKARGVLEGWKKEHRQTKENIPFSVNHFDTGDKLNPSGSQIEDTLRVRMAEDMRPTGMAIHPDIAKAYDEATMGQEYVLDDPIGNTTRKRLMSVWDDIVGSLGSKAKDTPVVPSFYDPLSKEAHETLMKVHENLQKVDPDLASVFYSVEPLMQTDANGRSFDTGRTTQRLNTGYGSYEKKTGATILDNGEWQQVTFRPVTRVRETKIRKRTEGDGPFDKMGLAVSPRELYVMSRGLNNDAARAALNPVQRTENISLEDRLQLPCYGHRIDHGDGTHSFAAVQPRVSGLASEACDQHISHTFDNEGNITGVVSLTDKPAGFIKSREQLRNLVEQSAQSIYPELYKRDSRAAHDQLGNDFGRFLAGEIDLQGNPIKTSSKVFNSNKKEKD